MSITYEVNIVCDECGDECVTGDISSDPITGAISAALEARDNGWKDNGEKWLCSACANGEEGPQT